MDSRLLEDGALERLDEAAAQLRDGEAATAAAVADARRLGVADVVIAEHLGVHRNTVRRRFGERDCTSLRSWVGVIAPQQRRPSA